MQKSAFYKCHKSILKQYNNIYIAFNFICEITFLKIVKDIAE